MCHGVVNNNTSNLRKRPCRHTSDHALACGNPSVKFLFIIYGGEIGWPCFKESCIKETGLPANCRRGTTMVANFCPRYCLLLSTAGYKRPRFRYFTTTVHMVGFPGTEDSSLQAISGMNRPSACVVSSCWWRVPNTLLFVLNPV